MTSFDRITATNSQHVIEHAAGEALVHGDLEEHEEVPKHLCGLQLVGVG